jgi:hypothetical protein
MTFSLRIKCDNDAFVDDVNFANDELAYLLKQVAARIADGEANGLIHDSNGNHVGEFLRTHSLGTQVRLANRKKVTK